MTTAKMYKWNGSARKRIWGLKYLLLWELFFDFMIELGQKLQGETDPSVHAEDHREQLAS